MATTISQIYRPVWHRRLVKRHRRHGAEALTSRTVRLPRHHSLPAAGLERCHCLRLPRICHSQLEPMASRDRGRPLLARHAFSCLAAPALSQRDLAWFCIARGKLSLFGGPRLLALGINGLPRAHSRSRLDTSIARKSTCTVTLPSSISATTPAQRSDTTFTSAPNLRRKASSASASLIDGPTSTGKSKHIKRQAKRFLEWRENQKPKPVRVRYWQSRKPVK